MLVTIVLNFLSALALAALIGAERELAGYKDPETPRKLKQFGGIRTHMLIGLFGAMSTYLATQFANQTIFLVMAVCMFLLLFAHYVQKAFVSKSVGLTTTMTGLLTFFIGALCVAGSGQLAVMITIAVTVILLSKKYTHRLLDHIGRKELTSTLTFAAILFVVLPLLPDTAIDPWGLVVPQKVWEVVILISGISYLGYIFSKIFGSRKGVILSGILGGLASSTAVTSSMAQQSKNEKLPALPFVVATLIASCMMFFRVLFWVFSFNQELTSKLFLPLFVMGGTGALVIGRLFLQTRMKKSTMDDTAEDVSLESPFQVAPALKFALFFLVITVLSGLATRYFGEQGTYILSFIAGFADVDAITVTLSNQALHGQIAIDVAARGILIAMLVNTAVKMGLAKIFGGRRFGNLTLVCFLIILATGGLMLFFI